ncbi:MAG TPA: protein kinase, partial [Candidatus Kapabacteria bacterium]|nr:protein kinase [Candidatus Kapabacteria bacterium]
MNEFPEIPGYKLISVLSTGGIARVYLGIQQKLNRKVAVKILKPFFLKDADTAERFEREAKTAAMLTHSNIVQIYDTGVIGEYHYIVMEYLEESLRERL